MKEGFFFSFAKAKVSSISSSSVANSKQIDGQLLLNSIEMIYFQ